MDYIAPEQTTNSAGVDGRADIYSLGCTLYFALSGQPPFPGGTSREKVMRHRREEPRPLLELVPSVPPGFARLIERMMAKEPDKRTSSSAAVEEELHAWATDDTVLPLDRRDDANYENSLAVLRAAEPSAEYSLPSLSGPELELPAAMDGEATISSEGWPMWVSTLLIAIGIVLGVVVVVVGLMLWLGRGG